MEQLFAADFSDVRVHAVPATALQGARAAALGPDLYFAAGAYAPEAPEGVFLLAHELAHVLQQRAAHLAPSGAAAVVLVDDAELEAQADHAGQLALAAAFHGAPLGSVALSPVRGLPRGARVRVLQHRRPDPGPDGYGDLVLYSAVFGVLWFLVYAAHASLQRRTVALQLQAEQRREAAIAHNSNQPIAQLPDELIHNIAQYLDPKSLTSFRGTATFAFQTLRTDSRDGQLTARDVYTHWLVQGGRPERLVSWQLGAGFPNNSRSRDRVAEDRFVQLVRWLRDNGNASVAAELQRRIVSRGRVVLVIDPDTDLELQNPIFADDYTEVFWMVLGNLRPQQLATLMVNPEFVAVFVGIPIHQRLQFWK
jgi:hypothetical protein